LQTCSAFRTFAAITTALACSANNWYCPAMTGQAQASHPEKMAPKTLPLMARPQIEIECMT
jgi:hypothetical protein